MPHDSSPSWIRPARNVLGIVVGCMSFPILVTLGHSLSKRAADDRTKFRRQAIWFTVSLVLIFSSIPWPFRPGFEAYGWW